MQDEYDFSKMRGRPNPYYKRLKKMQLSERIKDGNNAFAVDVYKRLAEKEGNIFFSPFSISSALAMTLAGARGETAEEMISTLRLDGLEQESISPAYAELFADIFDRSDSKNIVRMANKIWGEKSEEFLQEFKDITKTHFRAEMEEANFKEAFDAVRHEINQWVEENTEGKIKDLLPDGVLSKETIMVLVQSSYFKGTWDTKFEEDNTKDQPFFVKMEKGTSYASEPQVTAPLMAQMAATINYAEIDDTLKLAELKYCDDELSMVVLLPVNIEEFDSKLSDEFLGDCISQLRRHKNVDLYLPKFKMESSFSLNKILMSLGMETAFDPNQSDFSGMTPDPTKVCISAVVHKAFVDVNEEGTEAAAATAVAMTRCCSMTPPEHHEFRADRPFVFLIKENATGNIMYMGRVSNPS